MKTHKIDIFFLTLLLIKWRRRRSERLERCGGDFRKRPRSGDGFTRPWESNRALSDFDVKFGLGDGTGTYRTPLGTLFVSGKFGDHLCSGAVIKSRLATGEIVDPNAPGRDAIVSRVLWLPGKEEPNRAAYDRCIYIYGTPEERRICKPASFGCIRMRSKDVIAFYDLAHIGMHVTVTQTRIRDLLLPEEPSLLARSD